MSSTIDPPKTMSDLPGRAERKRLPSKRYGFNYSIKLGSHRAHVGVRFYPSGALGEVTIDAAKEGADLMTHFGVAARLVSIGLQYGTPVSEFVKTLKDVKINPCIVECEGVPELHGKMVGCFWDLLSLILEANENEDGFKD